MSCTTCLFTKPIPLCISAIIIGTINDTSIAVIVKIKNESTQRIQQLESTSDGAGLVTANVSQLEFMENHYTFSVHKSADYSNDLDITIGSETAKCVDVVFENCNEEVTSVELEIAE